MENFECEEIQLPTCVYLFNTEMFLFFLLEQNRNINETDGRGRTSLMLAAENNNVPLAEFILSLEATDAGVKDIWGRTALDVAATDEMRETIRKFIK